MFSTLKAAREIGVSKNTLLRWFREGRIDEVTRDRNGWRVFSEADVARIRHFKQHVTPPGGAGEEG